MSLLTPEKKEFLNYVAGGVSVLMNDSMLAEEIYTSFLPWPNKEWYEDPTEKYIYDNILDGASFSEDKFCKAMETIDKGTTWELFTYFDSRDMPISRAYTESCVVNLPESLEKFVECADFEKFLNFNNPVELVESS
tara:strand:+ start:282 stop:689 length:408 start_codon:yes stop_codon:yes gene_type:complete